MYSLTLTLFSLIPSHLPLLGQRQTAGEQLVVGHLQSRLRAAVPVGGEGTLWSKPVQVGCVWYEAVRWDVLCGRGGEGG